VSRRIAAHRAAACHDEASRARQRRLATGSRYAQAVARVAARYAQAPSYSEMQVAEAYAAQPAVHAALSGQQSAPAGTTPV